MRAGARGRRLAAAIVIVAGAAFAPLQGRADPNVLWKIVHGQCVPNAEQYGTPEPCDLVDLDVGYAVLKDRVGATQYLLIPTARVTGIEDPRLLAPGTPNYFEAAWHERVFTGLAARRPLPRTAISLAVNSRFGRSQNQLHIHIDCIRPEVRDALHRQEAAIGGRWAPLAEPLAGRRYWAMRVVGEDLGADPFRLLAAGKPGAAAAMGEQTLVVAGARFADGRPGFILLADQVNLAAGDRAHGEELQDHGCALARR